VANGTLTPDQARQVRAQYGGKLTMIDTWFGRVLDAIDRQDLWDTTAVVVCTDHGHYLGEKDIWGKPAVPLYEPLSRTPLLIAWPGVEPGSRDALTTTVDINATIRDVFGVEAEHRTHGRSLVPLLTGEATAVRDWALAGIWGREVTVVGDDGTKYVRAPAGDNAPLSMWSNRWSTMPIHRAPDIRLPRPDDRAWLDRMPGSTVPVIRQPFQPGDLLPFWGYGRFSGNHLFAVDDDPAEEHDLAGSPREKAAADLVREALLSIDAPTEHLDRLGLT
jgi:arylsulfatase A-like enzyme